MHAPSFPSPARFFTVFVLALCAMVAPADSPDFAAANSRFVLAQAAAPTTPLAEPTDDHGHAAPTAEPAIPDPNPKLNKKRAAFWGVTFMLATSLAFAVFGAWAIKKTPKSGQQRPE